MPTGVEWIVRKCQVNTGMPDTVLETTKYAFSSPLFLFCLCWCCVVISSFPLSLSDFFFYFLLTLSFDPCDLRYQTQQTPASMSFGSTDSMMWEPAFREGGRGPSGEGPPVLTAVARPWCWGTLYNAAHSETFFACTFWACNSIDLQLSVVRCGKVSTGNFCV